MNFDLFLIGFQVINYSESEDHLIITLTQDDCFQSSLKLCEVHEYEI